MLNTTVASGVNHAAVNFSQGMGKARIVGNMFDDLTKQFQPGATDKDVADSDVLYNNLLKGFGMGEKAHGDAGVVQYQQLEQKLVDETGSALQDNAAPVQAARAAYETAVNSAAQQKISVVVAAGNEGFVREEMTMGHAMAPVTLPDDFFANPLSAPGVITVGATGDTEKPAGTPEAIAYYSNPSSDVAVYADGTIGKAEGTSFSAPRVAAVTAALHRLMPDASNSQVESYLADNLTHNLAGPNGAVKVLDSAKVGSLMSHSDYLIA